MFLKPVDKLLFASELTKWTSLHLEWTFIEGTSLNCNNNEHTNTVASLDTSTTLNVDCYVKYMYMVLHMYTLRSDYQLHTSK